jgi:CRP/FNR family transcriptional regulator
MRRPVVDALRNTELFRDLDDRVLSVLAGHAVERTLRRDEILFIAGERATGIYVIAAGSVRAFRSGADGREQIIHVERAGATVGELPLFDDQPYPSTVAAEEVCSVIFLDRQTVLEMCHAHPEVAIAALRVLCRRLRKCAALVETLSLRPVGQRLALWILNEANQQGRKKGNRSAFDLNLSKEQLAARVGSVREVVSRAMARLDEKGLIRTDGQRIHVPDIRRLTEFAETDL